MGIVTVSLTRDHKSNLDIAFFSGVRVEAKVVDEEMPAHQCGAGLYRAAWQCSGFLPLRSKLAQAAKCIGNSTSCALRQSLTKLK